MPMIWLDLKEAGDFHFQSAVKKVSTPSPRISVDCPRVTPPARLSLPGFRRGSGQAFSLRLALPSRAGTSSSSPTGTAFLWEPSSRLLSQTTCISTEVQRFLAVIFLDPALPCSFHVRGAPTESHGGPGSTEAMLGPSLGGLPVHDRTRKECV